MTDIRTYNISACRNCDLKKNGMAVPFIGSELKCILIDEAPGENEIRQGEPFAGRSGKLLMDKFRQYRPAGAFERKPTVLI